MSERFDETQCNSRRRAAALWQVPMAAALALGLTAPAQAHHSYAMFDRTKTVSVTGTVTVWRWTNPHIAVLIKAPRPGQPDVLFEGASPSIYRKTGMDRTVTAVGQKVTITYHPMASGAPGGMIVTINGKGGV